MTKIKTVTPKDLLDWGLIFEINRKVLHPLGLAIAVEITEKGTSFSDGVWDYRDDPEGLLFSGETFDQGNTKFKKFMEEFGANKLLERANTLGYIYQTTAE